MKRIIRSVLASSLAAMFLIAGLTVSAAFDLYWTESDRIMGSDIDGENVTVVFDGSEAMAGVAVDILVTGDHIYWSDHPNSTAAAIWRAGRDGSNPQKIADFGDFRAPHFFTLDEANGHIYFTDFGRGIFRIDLDGSNEEWVFNGADAFPAAANHTGIYLRGPGDPVFLSTAFTVYEPGGDEFATWATAIATLPGSGATYGVVLDEDTQTLYYTTFNGGTLHSYNLATQEGELLASGLIQPLGVKLSPSKTHLLIAERARGISAFQLDNQAHNVLVHSSGAHFGVAVTADPGHLEPPPPLEDGEIAFEADFEDDEIGAMPAVLGEGGVWLSRTTPAEGVAEVVADTGNEFGFGTDNRFLRFESGRGFSLITPSFEPLEVVTMGFDFIGRVNEGDANRWLNMRLRAGSVDVNNTSIRMWDATHRPSNLSYGGNDIPIRFETIVNNSTEAITYRDPFGNDVQLSSGQATLWVYHYTTEIWEQLQAEFTYTRDANLETGIGIDNLWLQIDGNDPLRSFDMDNLVIVKGAHLSDLEGEPPPPPPFGGYVDADFNGIPLGEITRENAGDFVHGNLSDINFHSRYDADTDGDGSETPPILVVQDSEDVFGRGTDNQVLRTNRARGWRLVAEENNFNEEVMTLRIDMANIQAVAGGRLTSRFYDQGGNTVSRLEFRSTASGGGALDPNPGTFPYGEIVRFESVINNSSEEIEYETPDGRTKRLIAGGTDMWVNGQLVFSDSTSLRTATDFGPIMNYRLETFSTNRWDADIDLVQTLPGVELVAVDPFEPSPYRLQTVWTLGPGDRDYLTDDHRQRGLGYNPVTGHLIVPDREETIAIIDGATGAHVGTLSNAGISGGTFPLNHVVVAGDGAIYGANLTTDAGTNPLKVYRWASEAADPVLVYEGHPNEDSPSHDDPARDGYELRFGDTMAVRGSGMDTQILMAPRFGIYLTILTPEGSMENFVDNPIITDITTSPAGWLTHGLAFGPGDTFFGKRQPQFGSAEAERALLHVAFDLEEGTGTVIGTFDPDVFPNEIGPIGIDVERMLLVGLDSDAEVQDWPRRPAEVSLYDLSALSPFIANQPLDSKTFGGFNWNGNGAGQVVFGENDMVYVLDTNNGIAAFRIVVEAEPGEGYLAWADSHFPGETDPAVIGPDANPSGDGIRNLLKYALGLDPTVASREGLPVPGFETVGEDAYLSLAFSSPDNVDDLFYTVVVGSDLGSLTGVAQHVRSDPDPDRPGHSIHVYRDTEPVTANDRRFIGLEVEFQ